MTVPGYWMYETSGVLRPVVEKYLAGRWLDPDEIAVMQRYLAQWMDGDFRGPHIGRLRARVSRIESRGELESWLEDALDAGIDPL